MKRVPAACNAEDACEYLGCTPNRLLTLVANGDLARLGPNWYAYADLDECVEKIRRERKAGTRGKVQAASKPELTVETPDGPTPKLYDVKAPKIVGGKVQVGS